MLCVSNTDVHLCMTFFLSNAKDADLRSQCGHSHSLQIEVTQQADRLFSSLKKDIQGRASKGTTALKTKHVRFTREQGDFLKKKIDDGTNVSCVLLCPSLLLLLLLCCNLLLLVDLS